MGSLKIRLHDLNPVLVAECDAAFSDVDEFDAFDRDYLAEPADALTSPANSFGVMDGGLDLLLLNTFPGIQDRVQTMITEKFHGEMPVGCAELVPTEDSRWPWLICAPTMRVPENVARTMNAYTAFRAILLAVRRHNAASESEPIRTVVVPGLGTGVGRMPENRCAAQMRLAWDSMQGDGSIPSLSAIQSSQIKLLSV